MYSKVSTNLDFVSREKAILDFWKKNEIFKKSTELDSAALSLHGMKARLPPTAGRI